MIWLGDLESGFRLMTPAFMGEKDMTIQGNDLMVDYLQNAPYVYAAEGDNNQFIQTVLNKKQDFFSENGLVLMIPMRLGTQFVGLIGLGPEITGGRYGRDDFDLLAALCSHATSALLAVNNAERLAKVREQLAWSNLSAFVLHDIKNAATMLDLMRKNASEHINKAEFQQDMLDTIDDALKRMQKVQSRLSVLKGDLAPDFQPLSANDLMSDLLDKLQIRFPDLSMTLTCPNGIHISMDPDFFNQIMENILINAREAGATEARMFVGIDTDTVLRIEIRDNGPGITAKLLPKALFEPFKTAKASGNGIGLWQVSQLVTRLNGTIQADNLPEGGAIFTLFFPL